MPGNTIRLHRVLRATPERVYRAFTLCGGEADERLRYTDKFDDPGLPSGTELNVVQEGVPEAIPADACYVGWGESLALLAMLVEPEIPD